MTNKDTNISPDSTICCGKKLLTFSEPMVMGILNCTSDSFYDGGTYITESQIARRAQTILEEGGRIIDVGAVSSRPGAELLPVEEEIAKLKPIITMLRKEFPEAILSVDTCWSEVVKVVADAGADMINDISGGQFDEKMFATVADLQLPYVLMHTKGLPNEMQKQPMYKDIVQELTLYFSQKLEQLYLLGVKDVILDLGFGFGKTVEHNYELMKKMREFSLFKEPMLVGISRKSMIYKYFNTSSQEALNGTTVLNTYALLQGAKMLRVHDVREAVECVKIIQAINK